MRLNNTYSTHIASRYVLQRELGLKFPLGFRDKLHHKIYSSLQPSGSWDYSRSSSTKVANQISAGGVFNLEYSPDGAILIAACEQKSFIVFDPVTRKDVHSVRNAHSDCVNCVRFLDSRTFATCSDDTTVALWDIRNLKQKMRTLRGHSNWVKNIEYAREEGLLVTSGFDGCVFTWDINNYTEQGLTSQRVLHTEGLMRMRLSPDSTKMILCTAEGYLMAIHNLDFSTLGQDLAGFKPFIYRLMQISQTRSHLFTSKRNRVELISDWPDGNKAEIISALQVHPYGWCVVSRNTSNEDSSEWTCVHDIQDVSVGEDCELPEQPPRKKIRSTATAAGASTSDVVSSNPQSESSSSDRSDDEAEAAQRRPQVEVRITAPLQWGSLPEEAAGFHVVRRRTPRVESPASHAEHSDNLQVHIHNEEVLEALENMRRVRSAEDPPEFRIRHRVRRSRLREATLVGSATPGVGRTSADAAATSAEAQRENDSNWEESDPNLTAHFVRAVADLAARSIHLLDPFRLRSRHSVLRHPPSLTYSPNNGSEFKAHPNLHRLTHFVQEPNVGRGYIKELCFSPDGRVIASPFGNGVRLLTFNSRCADMSHSLTPSTINGSQCRGGIDKEPAFTLHELAYGTSHSDVVVTTKFSPIHPIFVSGCLAGKIVWHQPLL